MDKILYFPTISIPQTQWLMSSMFYWDKVGSIVPLEFLDEPSQLGEEMRKLVEIELIEQVVPENYLWNIPTFEKDFLDFVDSEPKFQPIARNREMQLNSKGKILLTKEVHMGKLRNLGSKLEQRGLAVKGKDSWYTMESSTASYFMTYLATILGQLTNYVPMTDSYNELANFIPNHENQNTREALKEKLRTRVIERILPVPAFVEDSYDIVRFKEKHYYELRNFRRHIEEFILNLEEFPEVQIEERIKLFVESSQDEIRCITEKMSSFKWDFMKFSTLCSLSSSLIVIGAGVMGGSPSSITSGSMGLLGAVASASNHDQISEIRRRPLAYAAIVERNFDGKPFNINTRPYY